RFFGSPTLYSVLHDAGAGRTLPLGVFSAAGSWHGGLALALQQVDASHLGSSSVNTPVAFHTVFRLTGQLAPSVQDLSPGPRSHGNALAFVMIGTTLPASGLSVGGSVRWAKLRAVDGVDLLYPGSTSVRSRRRDGASGGSRPPIASRSPTRRTSTSSTSRRTRGTPPRTSWASASRARTGRRCSAWTSCTSRFGAPPGPRPGRRPRP